MAYLKKWFKFYRKGYGEVQSVHGEIHTKVQTVADPDSLNADILEKIDEWQKTVDDFKKRNAEVLNRKKSENADIIALHERITAMQEAHIEAGRNAIQVFGENDILRAQIALYEGDISEWVSKDAHKKILKQNEELKRRNDVLSHTHSNLMQDWAEFMNDYKCWQEPAPKPKA